MKIILKNRVKIAKQPMLGSIVAAITEVQTPYKCSYLPIISGRLCIYDHTFLVMRKQGSDNLH